MCIYHSPLEVIVFSYISISLLYHELLEKKSHAPLGDSAVKNPLAIQKTQETWVRYTPGSGRSPGEGNGNPLQYSCLENCMDRGALRATVHSLANSQTGLK